MLGCRGRYPYLSSSQAGVSLCETVKQANLADLGTRLQRGLSAAAGWDTPTLLLTGDADKYIKARWCRCTLCMPCLTSVLY